MNRLVLLSALLSLSSTVHAATTPPKVVFIGDYITYDWSTGFSANPNWINKGGGSYVAYFGNGDSTEVLARFQSDVVDLHPAIVHILIGEGDADATDDAIFQSAIPTFLTNLNAMVQEAKAANIKVILGTEPPVLTYAGQLGAMNSVVASYGAANNIPVINYGDPLCGCVGATLGPLQQTGIGNDNFAQYGGGPYIVADPNPAPFSSKLVVSKAGYSLMTQLAENAIATLSLTLQGGYLEDVEQNNDNVLQGNTLININTVSPGAVVQFTPVGHYSDGSYHPLLNSSFQGSSGTWTSSNPLVMYVNQTGLTWATSPGTAIIHYTPPNGVKFSEWIMYVKPPYD